MNVGDEGTGAHLQVTVYDQSRVAAIDAQQATVDLNQCFVNWGLPRAIRIDNGYPFVYPGARQIPTLSQLWWIGLGIQVIKNKPACPQQNGIVENLQGTLCNWSNPKIQPDKVALQNRLNEESIFQKQFYRIPAKQYKTRYELYPGLQNNPRKYNPDDFDIQKVYDYLATQTWEATIRANGVLKFWAVDIYIGKSYKHQTAFISFDPVEKVWLFRDRKGTLLKTSYKAVPNPDTILAFALMSKNFDTT